MTSSQIVTVVGARPQFVKAAVISRLVARREDICEHLIHTGQHYDDNMSDVFFREMDIPRPVVNLEIGSGGHGKQTGEMLAAIEHELQVHKPNAVLVYGDTNSTLAGALAAAKLHIPVAHIEAGLRSFNRKMPEETNRVVTDHVSDLLFAPTETAVENLRHEGLQDRLIEHSGDVMFDAALHYLEAARALDSVAQRNGLEDGHFTLATIHRAENTDSDLTLRNILDGLNSVGSEMPVLFPMHPRTLAAIHRARLDVKQFANIHVVPPVSYFEMLNVLNAAGLIVTDSGGVQKEAFFFRTPCVTLRTETEWLETISLGWNRLCSPTSSSEIATACNAMLGVSGEKGSPYGDGRSGEAILEALIRFIQDRR